MENKLQEREESPDREIQPKSLRATLEKLFNSKTPGHYEIHGF